MDEVYSFAALLLAGLVSALPDVYRLFNNHVLSKIFHLKKIEDDAYGCKRMVQLTFMFSVYLYLVSVVDFI